MLPPSWWPLAAVKIRRRSRTEGGPRAVAAARTAAGGVRVPPAALRVEAPAPARAEAQAPARVEAQGLARVEAPAPAPVEAQGLARAEAQAPAPEEAQGLAQVAALDSSSGGGTSSSTGGGGGSSGGSAPPLPNRVRQIIPFDASWLYHNGDATGASGATFADSAWTALSVPHDWAIEGTESPRQSVLRVGGHDGTRGLGGFGNRLVPQALHASADLLGRQGLRRVRRRDGEQHCVRQRDPNREPSLRLRELPIRHHCSVKFGTADNVIAVECDTSKQPASRFYAGAGIYRHVRLLATNPVHVDQWATYVQTPAATITTARRQSTCRPRWSTVARRLKA